MSELDLFSDNKTPVIDPNKDYYKELVGPGLKYSDNQAFARSRVEADAHIARLEDEQKRLREDLATRIQYEDFLTQLKLTPPSTPGNTTPVTPATDVSGTMTPEALERLVEQKLQQREQVRSAEQNLNLVDAKLRESYGPNYAQLLKNKAQELEMSEQFIKNLAATNPKALFRLLGVGEKPSKDNFFQAPLKSEFNPAGNIGGKRGKSHYDEIYKTNPVLYWTPKIQNEMFEACKDMGVESFNDS